MKGFYGISHNSYSNINVTNKIFPKGLKKSTLPNDRYPRH